MNTSSWVPKVMALRFTGTSTASVTPSSHVPDSTKAKRSSLSSGAARSTRTPGWWRRNSPTMPAIGSAASVGRLARDSEPASTPATAATAARPVSRSRRTWRAGSSSADPAASQLDPMADPGEERDPELGFEILDRRATGQVGRRRPPAPQR